MCPEFYSWNVLPVVTQTDAEKLEMILKKWLKAQKAEYQKLNKIT